MALTAYGCHITAVYSFKYLVQVLLESGDNWPEVIWNLRRAQQKLERLSWVLGLEGADVQTSGMFYSVLVQAVLLYFFGSWFVPPRIRKALVGFHHWAIRSFTEQMPHQGGGVTWTYPYLEEAVEEELIHEVETYFARRQNTAAKYIMTRPTMDLCISVVQRPRARI